ncbi:AAA family ATPase [Spirochaetota bacterium]
MKSITNFITEYELLNLYKAVEKIRSKHGLQIKINPDTQTWRFNDKISIPIEAELEITGSKIFPIMIKIGEANQKENNFYKTKYRINCIYNEDNESFARELMNEFAMYMKKEIPHRFMSMEHLHVFHDSSVGIHITTLPENLLIAGSNALNEIFQDFKYKGKAVYDGNVRDRLRLEIKESKFRYVELGQFKVFEKDGCVAAAGILKSSDNHITNKNPKYNVLVYASKDYAEKVTNLFDEKYEDLLLSNFDVKGGKFTGDQKIIKLKEKLSFGDIVLEDSVREKIKREIFDFFSFEEFYKKADLPFKRGVALYGPPGTGKTMIAKIIATTMEETVIWVKAGDIATADDINRIFRLARIGKPSIVILEDIDFYTEDRNKIISNKIGIATLMSNLDGLEENESILVVVTTNRIEAVEKAIIERPGRIDSRIFMGELGRDSIARLLEKKLGNFKRSFESFKELIPEHTVMTGAMVIELSTTILRHILRNTGDTSAEIVINEDEVKKAVKDIERLQNKKSMGFGKVAV